MIGALARTFAALALGVAIGLGLVVVSDALFGDRGVISAIVVLIVGAAIYMVNSWRWLRQMRADLEADTELLEQIKRRLDEQR